MEEIKILLYALVSFLSQEDIPIAATSAEIEINTKTKQITLHQKDIYSLERYRAQARAGLDSLMRTNILIADVSPIQMTSKHMYEDEGKLHAILYLNYKDIKDLRKMSFYADADGNLSYPYMEDYNYVLQTGRVDCRYVRFDAGTEVKFKMQRKELLFEGIYSLLEDWKALQADKFVDMSALLSRKEFEKLRKFIFKKGDRRTFRNFDNNNPHYRFDDFDVYLATGDQRSVFENEKLKPEDYTELVIDFSGGFSLFLTGEKLQGNKSQLKPGNVYWHNVTYRDQAPLEKYLTAIKSALK